MMNVAVVTRSLFAASAVVALCIPVVLVARAVEPVPAAASTGVEITATPSRSAPSATLPASAWGVGAVADAAVSFAMSPDAILAATFASLESSDPEGGVPPIAPSSGPAVPPKPVVMTAVVTKRSRALDAIDAAVPAVDEPSGSPTLAYAAAEEPRKAGTADLECLAQAIYFEARGEPAAGRLGVAQVIMNRTRSGAFPDTVCGVVHQANKRGCQFTFTCDGRPETIRDRNAWKAAVDLATRVLAGKATDPGLVNSLHYHSTGVRPGWASTKKVAERIGAHIFYER